MSFAFKNFDGKVPAAAESGAQEREAALMSAVNELLSQYISELEGVQAALGMILPGDILMLLVKGERKESLKAIQNALDQTLK